MPLYAVMELVMFSQLYAGMRGLGHVYRAVGDLLPVFGEPTVAVESSLRAGRPTREAFKLVSISPRGS